MSHHYQEYDEPSIVRCVDCNLPIESPPYFWFGRPVHSGCLAKLAAELDEIHPDDDMLECGEWVPVLSGKPYWH